MGLSVDWTAGIVCGAYKSIFGGLNIIVPFKISFRLMAEQSTQADEASLLYGIAFRSNLFEKENMFNSSRS